MDAAVEQHETVDSQDERAPEPATQKTPDQLFRWSSWIHIGPGAEECEDVDESKDGGVNECGNPLHFHGWLRLPNQFQHREIREKAMAAKARRTRGLRDPDSDSGAVLEEELDALARLGDQGKSEMVDELIARDAARDYLEAIADVAEIEAEGEEDGEPTKRFAHIEDDERRLAELRLMPPDKRPQEEHDELVEHVAAHRNALMKRLEEIRKPRKDALMARDVNALVDMVRDARVSGEGDAAFHHTYAVWSMLIGTLRQPRGPRVFASREAMEEAAPEVVQALSATLDDLEQTRNAAGN